MSVWRGIQRNDYEKYAFYVWKIFAWQINKRSSHIYILYKIYFLFSETGGLFMLAIRLMQLFSSNDSDFTKLAGILGLYFQIRDDYCNLCLTEVWFFNSSQYIEIFMTIDIYFDKHLLIFFSILIIKVTVRT